MDAHGSGIRLGVRRERHADGLVEGVGEEKPQGLPDSGVGHMESERRQAARSRPRGRAGAGAEGGVWQTGAPSPQQALPVPVGPAAL